MSSATGIARRLLGPCGVSLILLLPTPATAGGALSALTSALRRETSTLATLESLTEWVARTEQDLDEARRHRARLDHQVAEATRRIGALRARSTQRRTQIQQRTRTLYKMSRGGVIRLLLEAVDGEELSTRLSAASLIVRRDVRELELYHAELARLADEQQRLERQRGQQSGLLERLEVKHRELQTARAKQLQALRRLQSSRRQQHQVAEELDQQQRTLLRRIGELSWRLQVAGGFAARKGKLPRPVAGPIVGIFGQFTVGVPNDSRNKGERKVEVLRRGLTFRPAGHSPVGAVARGVVRLADVLRGYGNVVLVEHSDAFYTLYGFLSQIQVRDGEEVDKGTVLGRAGLDPLTGRPATYFELRHNAEPLDPVVWLRR
jgi:murein hydrolase activator